jgi:hypothetical protein
MSSSGAENNKSFFDIIFGSAVKKELTDEQRAAGETNGARTGSIVRLINRAFASHSLPVVSFLSRDCISSHRKSLLAIA